MSTFIPVPCVLSEGTLRPQDLIPKFLDYLELLDPKRVEVIKKEYHDVIEAVYAGKDGKIDGVWANDSDSREPDEEMSEALDNITEEINGALPDDLMLDKAEGDGACYIIKAVAVDDDEYDDEEDSDYEGLDDATEVL